MPALTHHICVYQALEMEEKRLLIHLIAFDVFYMGIIK